MTFVGGSEGLKTTPAPGVPQSGQESGLAPNRFGVRTTIDATLVDRFNGPPIEKNPGVSEVHI